MNSDNDVSQKTSSTHSMTDDTHTVTTEIETGIEYDTPADVRAYADTGEYATTWEINEIEPGLVEVETARHEAGLAEVVGKERFTFDADETTLAQFAQKMADADPQLAIELAKERFEADE